ncbi:MAG: HAMP domain-containing sensor histidine kinase, partial [Steroidobacteraceae bacterium]
LPEKVQHLLEIAYRNTDRLALLVSDILDIEKIESGGMTFDQDHLDLRDLVAQALEANQAYAATREVQLLLTPTSNSVFVVTDPHRLLQVMANLLSNAAKFSPAGSQVDIDVAIVTASHVRVSVRDHGSGIPESFKPRVFQKFSQADSSDSRAKSGTGLGLAISRAIIERLGGTIGYVCDSGTGTTFYFELPLAAASPHSMFEPRMQSAG